MRTSARLRLAGGMLVLLPALLLGGCGESNYVSSGGGGSGASGLRPVYQIRIRGVTYSVNRSEKDPDLYEVRTIGGAPGGYDSVSRAIRWAYGCSYVKLLTIDKVARYAEAKGSFCKKGQQRFQR